MIVNDRVKHYYRYSNEIHHPGDVITGESLHRNLNDKILPEYDKCIGVRKALSNGYVYMTDQLKEVDGTTGNYHVYEVEPMIWVLQGNDKYSPDNCNDFIQKLMRTHNPADIDVAKIANDYASKFYLHEGDGVKSYLTPSCKVIKVIK